MSSDAETAERLFGRLARDAIHHRGRCTWMGPAPENRDGRLEVVTRPLRPDLYGGTAGVGLALAEAAEYSGDPGYRTTAERAIRHSLDAVSAVQPALRLGLHTGAPGIALAAVLGGLAIGTEELVERGLETALHEADGETPRAADLVSGRAGAIIGLLAIGRAAGDPRLTEKAERLGDEIVAEAASRRAWSWPHEGNGTGLAPAGLAHGTAGVAAALLELWAATGEPRFRTAAEEGAAAENDHLDPALGNWTLDTPPTSSPSAPISQVSHVSWCNGAAGMALARSHAWRLTGDHSHRAAALTAIDTTARWLRAATNTGRGDPCLCHGLAGNAEVLSDCVSADPAATHGVRDVADAVAAMLEVELMAGGVPGRPASAMPPGLMLGLAGIARFYLRRVCADLPSILLPPSGHGIDRTSARLTGSASGRETSRR